MTVSRDGTESIEPSIDFALAMKAFPYSHGCSEGNAIAGCVENLTIRSGAQWSYDRDLPGGDTSYRIEQEARPCPISDLGLQIPSVDTRKLGSEMNHEYRDQFQHDMNRWDPIWSNDFFHRFTRLLR
jgi:hypothetical protein